MSDTLICTVIHVFRTCNERAGAVPATERELAGAGMHTDQAPRPRPVCTTFLGLNTHTVQIPSYSPLNTAAHSKLGILFLNCLGSTPSMQVEIHQCHLRARSPPATTVTFSRLEMNAMHLRISLPKHNL